MDRRDLISSLFLLAIAVFVCTEAISLGIGALSSPGAGFLLFLASLALGAFSVLLIVANSLKKRPKTRILDMWRGVDWKSVVLAVSALVLFPVFLPRAGYLPTSFGLMLILFGLGRMKSWITATGAVVTTALSYLIFKVLLGVPFS